MLRIIPAIIISYLIGSIPTAYIFGRLVKGVDIRRYGSGNVGATNALRVLGKVIGACVLLLDILKGFIAVVLAGVVFTNREIAQIIAGVLCVCGHNWTIFLRFKGGKGMATTLGVLLGLSAGIKGLGIILGLAISIWLITFLLFRIVSVASIVSAVSLPVSAVISRQSSAVTTLSFALAMLVLLRHRSNIVRIIQGKEPRLTFK